MKKKNLSKHVQINSPENLREHNDWKLYKDVNEPVAPIVLAIHQDFWNVSNVKSTMHQREEASEP